MLKVAIDVFEGRQTCKSFLLGIKVFLDAEHIGREAYEATHIFGKATAPDKIGTIIAKIIIVSSLHMLAVGFRIAFDNSFVTLVCYFLTYPIFIVGTEYTLTLATVLRI